MQVGGLKREVTEREREIGFGNAVFKRLAERNLSLGAGGSSLSGEDVARVLGRGEEEALKVAEVDEPLRSIPFQEAYNESCAGIAEQLCDWKYQTCAPAALEKVQCA